MRQTDRKGLLAQLLPIVRAAGADSNLVGDSGQLAGLPIDSLGEFAADLWVADTLDKWAQAEKPLFEEKLDLQIAKFLRKIVEARLAEARRAELQKLRAADRHLRRSALQLSRAIKTKGEAKGEAPGI